ncbi:MAG: hypothetical protein JWQ72_543 [Polaromonas sp.]|nr:hypothetical protein [Polaromonas sp.]
MNLLNRLNTLRGVACARRATRLDLAAGMLALLAACASPITAKVTSFNQWPADAAGSSFSYIVPADKANDLEVEAYQGYVQAELEKLGLKRAAPGQVGRFQVDVVTGNGTRDRKYREAIYQDYYVYQPPYRDAAGNVYPGFWAPDRFGSRYVGDREVVRTVQVSNLRLRLLDSRGSEPGKPKAVFESRAVYEGDNEDLPDLVPYLVRAVFDGFPGPNGRVRVVKFDARTGAMVSR